MSVDNSRWSVERDYPHPPERVFTAWAEPSLKVRWFDLSGNDNPDYRGDFRVGGMERFRTPDGVRPTFTYDAQYRDIVENERIVTTYEMSMDGQRTSVSVATVELHATPAGTHLSTPSRAPTSTGSTVRIRAAPARPLSSTTSPEC